MMIQFTKKEFDIRSVKTNSVSSRNVLLALFYFASTHLFAQSSDQQNGQVAPELVGKWCFINLTTNTTDAITNSCITLNADGTFEASLDRSTLPNSTSFTMSQNGDYGKWWVNGNRIFYNSPANGQGSFIFQKANHPRLENTPMIVINGISFATASSHDPW